MGEQKGGLHVPDLEPGRYRSHEGSAAEGVLRLQGDGQPELLPPVRPVLHGRPRADLLDHERRGLLRQQPRGAPDVLGAAGRVTAYNKRKEKSRGAATLRLSYGGLCVFECVIPAKDW